MVAIVLLVVALVAHAFALRWWILRTASARTLRAVNGALSAEAVIDSDGLPIPGPGKDVA